MKDKLYYELLNRALDEEIGLAIETTNKKQMQLNLHAAARGLEKYEDIIIALPSLENFIFLTKKSVDLNDFDTP